MVARVWGEANGDYIIFAHQSGSTWNATCPWDNDGEYIVEMYAEDTAGNTAYLCSMLFIISGHELQGYVVPRGFAGTDNTNDYVGLPTISQFLGEVQEKGFKAEGKEKEYEIEAVKGGYGIERIICSRDGH